MEFWGVEVKSGSPLEVKPGKGMVIHLSQASFGEVKANKNECANLFVNVDGKKLVLGTLLSDKLPQQLFDLVFDRDFELSHNSKSGSIYFFGYKAENPDQEGEEFADTDDSEEEEEDLPVQPNNGKPDNKAKKEKPEVAAAAAAAPAPAPTAAGKQRVKIVEPAKVEKPEDDSDEDSDDDSDEDSDEDGPKAGDLMDEDDESDSEDDESDSDEDDDETPKKAAPSKKRGAESEIKTPASGKKAKLATPQQKTDDKKTAHVATPHPAKQAGKTPATNKAQTPKSGGSHSCGSCNKTFGSENALQSHTKAKHSAAK